MKLETTYARPASWVGRALSIAGLLLGVGLLMVGAATDPYVGVVASGLLVLAAVSALLTGAMGLALAGRAKHGVVTVGAESVTLGRTRIAAARSVQHSMCRPPRA